MEIIDSVISYILAAVSMVKGLDNNQEDEASQSNLQET